MSVLVLSWDRLGDRMAGSAIRALEMSRALAQAGLRVTLVAPEGSTIHPQEGLELACVPDVRDVSGWVDRADVVVVSGRVELMTAVKKPLVVDLYDPFVLSNLDLFGEDFNRSGGRALLALRWLEHHLRHGDFFLCASARQRSFWLGMLTAAGRVNRANYEADPSLERLLDLVPFGVSDVTPKPAPSPVVKGVLPGIGRDDRVVLWAGGMWNWLDPLTLVRATARLRARRPEIKTLILGARHPNPEIGEMKVAREARALAKELGILEDGVTFVDWVPYDERGQWILEADVGVSLHRRGVESEFAFRTRVLDYLWCERPMVLTEGDELSSLVEEKRLGGVVPPGDEAAVAHAIEAVLDEPDPEGRTERVVSARWDLRWARVIEPLAEFCRNPHHAADRAGDAWFASPEPTRDSVPTKDQALVTETFVSDARAISEPLGPTFAPWQRFTATYDHLCQVDVLMWVEPPVDGATLVFELLALDGAPEEVVLARVAVPAPQLPHCDWQRFEFRPIAGSRGREFAFRLRIAHAPGAEASWGRVCVWRCAGAHGAPEKGDGLAFLLRYLVAGVSESMPVGTDEFLFLHNATLPLAEGEGAERSRPHLGPPIEDLEGVRAALARVSVRAEAAERRAEALAAERDDRLLEAAREAARAEVARANTLRGLGRDLRDGLRTIVRLVKRGGSFVLMLVLTAISAAVAAVLGIALALADLLPAPSAPSAPADERDARSVRPDDPVSVVIPTWNGRELLDMSLPPLVEALRRHGHPEDEILVVDNGSEDDTRDAVTRLAAEAPVAIRLVGLDRNEGFAGATNRGALEARNPVLIFLNNDMVVEPDFVQPLLDVFGEEPSVFGVSCQIDFIDPNRPRWETGKVHATLRRGLVRLFHLDRFDEDKTYPIFFAGGGASAYDRSRFLALGGFDEAVFSPVYIEDVDLGYRAWKRGWASLLAPRSRVHHKHRGTTRRIWSEARIHSFFVKNLAALLWKNTDSWRLLGRHLAGLVLLPHRVRRQEGTRAAAMSVSGLVRQIPTTLRARRRERAIPRVLGDEEILNLSRYRHVYRARFHPDERRGVERPQVLVVSPYSPVPAVHGGAVRMLNLIREMRERCDVTLISFADTPAEVTSASLAVLKDLCRDVVVLPRDLHGAGGPLSPVSTQGFFSPRMFEVIETWLEKRDFDVVQVEYTHMAQYLPPPCRGMLRVLVEHDITFVAAARARQGETSAWRRAGLWFDGLRTLRHEVRAVEAADRVLTMSDTDRDTLARFVDPEPIVVVPNGVSCRDFPYAPDEAEPATILFVGFFRHEPNVEAVLYFVDEILPKIRARVPEARFRVVGAYPPPTITDLAARDPGIEVAGMVPETASHYRRATVFIAPIRRGSGTRLKILEAMASGCPVVSTSVGAEGLGAAGGEIAIADEPEAFAEAVASLLRDASRRRALVARARRFAEERYDWPAIAKRLFDAYGWNGTGTPEHHDA
ncbi:MAG: glycosyltransferase [Deltaproteobacteria bacterium]|nr:glycosyltransferase [Deltaproteobacteria bacterium]